MKNAILSLVFLLGLAANSFAVSSSVKSSGTVDNLNGKATYDGPMTTYTFGFYATPVQDTTSDSIILVRDSAAYGAGVANGSLTTSALLTNAGAIPDSLRVCMVLSSGTDSATLTVKLHTSAYPTAPGAYYMLPQGNSQTVELLGTTPVLKCVSFVYVPGVAAKVSLVTTSATDRSYLYWAKIFPIRK